LAYPFAYLHTVAELRGRLITEFGCEWKSTTYEDVVTGGRETVYYFERVVDGRVLTYTIHFHTEKERPLWPVIRSICSRLKIDPSAFGFTLG
jgi:hypothetical protein